MKTNKPILISFCLLLLSLSFTVRSDAQTLNFSGDWKINMVNSDFENLPTSFAANEFKILQNQNSIKFDRAVLVKDSIIKVTEEFKFDGRISVTTPQNRKKEASIKWSPNGTSLIETATQTVNDNGINNQFQSIETFSMSADKKILFYTRQVISDKVNFTIKATYDKN